MDTKNIYGSLDELRHAAEQGDPNAQSDLGWRYHTGEGVPKDYTEALKWYHKAAAQGDATAQNRIGVCNEKGEGVPKDLTQAVCWYHRAADQGHAKAQSNLGICYAQGNGVPQDHAEAVKWFRLSAQQGFEWGQSNLGYAYQKGEGVPKDAAEAVRWYRLAAEQGNAEAQNSLGFCFETGLGVPKNEQEAVKWYRLAAESGDPRAQTFFGYCLIKGLGVAKDAKEAVNWFTKAAEQGHAPGQGSLGMCYATGQGVAKDFERAKSWLSLAAQQNDPEATYQLRVLFFRRYSIFGALTWVVGVAGYSLLAYHWTRQPFEVNGYALAAFCLVVLASGCLFLGATFVLEKCGIKLLNEKDLAVDHEHIFFALKRRPWQLLLTPSEDGFFLLPLLYVGINPVSAGMAALLFAAAHYPAYPWKYCIPKGVAYFIVALFILPFGIWSVVTAHLLFDTFVLVFTISLELERKPGWRRILRAIETK